MGEIIEFPSNGATAQGYLATPSSANGPAVIVIQEWWGLVGHITDVCERFSREGFFALAPDLYHGTTTTEPDEAGKLLMGLNLAQAAKDMGGAVDELRRRSGNEKVGVVGFCMGGGLALLLGTTRPDAVAAVVPFYGVVHPAAGEPDWSKFEAAVQGHYAQHDHSAGPDAVGQLATGLLNAGKRAEIYTYPGTQHAFFNDDRPEVYDREAAALAWGRTLTFLRTELS
jgi:carboxymethylenebutenolidase